MLETEHGTQAHGGGVLLRSFHSLMTLGKAFGTCMDAGFSI